MIGQVRTATKYALLSFQRSPAATFFTVILPLIFLVIFGFIFGDEVHDSGAKVITFLVAGILAMSITSATFVNLAMSGVISREAGQLKRLRGTPARPLVWVVAQTLASFVIVAISTVIVIIIGRLFFGVAFNLETLGVFAISILIGSVALSALGLAVTAVIPNEDAAPAITNALVLPLYFVSDVFVLTEEGGSGFINRVGDFFPIKPLAHSLQPSFNPFLDQVEFPWEEWAVIAIWGVAGVVLATRFFRWSPARDRQ